MKVPFLDLNTCHAEIAHELLPVVCEVMDSGLFSGGPYVEKFEREFADYCGARFVVGVGSGTEALWLSLLASGVKPGDEVITVPSSFMATAEAISYCGATPVFVDIEDQSYTMDPYLLEKAITRKTKAIIPVHLFGQMASMDPILKIANQHGIPVVEDACQAHGATYGEQKAGTFGLTGCFSFYPGKNLGAFGEAGAITTNDENMYERIKVLRDHGQKTKYIHDEIGWNARMDGIQGAILSVKLRYLDQNNGLRRKNAGYYHAWLGENEDIKLPREMDDRTHVFHVFSVRLPNRDVVLKELKSREIGCGIHYPVPIHLQNAYSFLGYGPGSFPVAEKCAQEFLSLPMFPELSEDQIHYICDNLQVLIPGASERYSEGELELWPHIC